jgi:hypothetical protein
MRVLDLAVHAWGLARAGGAAENLQPVLVEYLLALVPKFELDWRRGGYSLPAPENTADMSPPDSLARASRQAAVAQPESPLRVH